MIRDTPKQGSIETAGIHANSQTGVDGWLKHVAGIFGLQCSDGVAALQFIFRS